MLLVMLLFAVVAEAQQQNYREMHKVKKGETLFGIALGMKSPWTSS